MSCLIHKSKSIVMLLSNASQILSCQISVKMADVLAARREARRRKILGNSDNRLLIITGKSSDECPRESPNRTIVPDPEYNVPIAATSSSFSRTPEPNGVLHSEPEPVQFIPTRHEIDAGGDGEIASDLAPLLPSLTQFAPPQAPKQVPTATLSFWEKVSSYKYDIVLLSLFIQLLYGMSLITFEGGYFFLPVILYVMTKMIYSPTLNTSSIANVLMLLNVMPQARVHKILYITQCLSVISRDTFVYIFTTICIQSLWITVGDWLIT